MPDSGAQVPEIPEDFHSDLDVRSFAAACACRVVRKFPQIEEAVIAPCLMRELGIAFLAFLDRIVTDKKWYSDQIKIVNEVNERLTRENAALREQVERIKHPHIYTGTYYAVAKVPKICPECDCTTFVSYGTKGMICYVCSLFQANDELEDKISRLSQPVTDEEWLLLCAGDHVEVADWMQRSDIDRFLSSRAGEEEK